MYTLNERTQLTKSAELRHILTACGSFATERPSAFACVKMMLPSILCLTTLGAMIANQASMTV
jgi:hypothetical protein